MAQPERPLSPFMNYRWQYTNTLSLAHRVTGVLLTAGFFLLVYWLAAAAGGRERYAEALAVLGTPLARVILLGTLFSFCYHLLCGIRHLVWDTGRGFELPVARASGWAVALGALVLTAVVWIALAATLGGAA